MCEVCHQPFHGDYTVPAPLLLPPGPLPLPINLMLPALGAALHPRRRLRQEKTSADHSKNLWNPSRLPFKRDEAVDEAFPCAHVAAIASHLA